MKKVFIRTKNVKRFVALMDELQKLPPNIPKLALVYGEHGLGKTQTIQWWVDKNDSVYVRATQEMTSRWLLSEIAEELGEEPYWHTQETFELIENNLRQNPKVIIVDEVDYLVEKHTIETLRDLHDKTSCPIVLVGMGFADKKLARYPHLCDRLYKTLKFEQFNQEDIKEILVQLTDLVFTPDAIEYLSTRTNQFRQLVKLVNKIEKLSKTNQIAELDEYILKGMLNERRILTSTGANVISELTSTKCRLVGGKS
jgi:DNA transposition AAA+ family ATPase